MIKAFSFALDGSPIHALLITILILVCLHGKLIQTYGLYLITIKLLLISAATFEHKSMNVEAMKQAFQGSLEKEAGSYEQMKSVAHAYASKQEGPLQEAVYQIIPEL